MRAIRRAAGAFSPPNVASNAMPRAPRPSFQRPAALTRRRSMIAVLWHHGPAMLDRMKARGVAWPRLDAADMSGLIAFLNSSKKEKP